MFRFAAASGLFGQELQTTRLELNPNEAEQDTFQKQGKVNICSNGKFNRKKKQGLVHSLRD